MTVLRIPSTAWRWQSTLLVLLLLTVPIFAVLELAPSGDELPQVAAVRTVVIAVGLLVASVSLYLHSRITGLDVSGWLSVAIGLAAVPTLTYGFYCFTHPEAITGTLPRQVLYRIAQMLLILGVLLMSRRRLRIDALALALALGLILAVIRQLSLGQPAPGQGLTPGTTLLAAALLGLATLGTGLPILGIVTLPTWLRARSFLALGLLGASTTLDPVATRDGLAGLLGLLTAVAGSVLVASTSIAYVHLTLVHKRTEIADLTAELARAESGLEADRVRLHEIDSTVAGIASASRLILTTPGITAGRRDVLEAMMAAEMARLQRLTTGRDAVQAGVVPLDDVIGRVVLQHRARGSGVEWQLSGVQVAGSAADIAEVLDALLHNAGRHGNPELIRVVTDDRVREVRVSVIDDGPGVPPEHRSSLFEAWSDDDTRSLPRACDLARAMGGDLWLADSEIGATFVLRLQPADAHVEVHPEAPRAPRTEHPALPQEAQQLQGSLSGGAVRRGGAVSC